MIYCCDVFSSSQSKLTCNLRGVPKLLHKTVYIYNIIILVCLFTCICVCVLACVCTCVHVYEYLQSFQMSHVCAVGCTPACHNSAIPSNKRVNLLPTSLQPTSKSTLCAFHLQQMEQEFMSREREREKERKR